MGKLVALKLGDGSFEQRFPVTLQIGEDGDRPSVEITGRLPSASEIHQDYSHWRVAYRSFALRSRLEAKGSPTFPNLRTWAKLPTCCAIA